MKDGINPPLFRIRGDLTNDLNRHVVTSILTRNMAPLPLFLFYTSIISRAAINNAQNRLRSETPRIMRSISFDRDLLAWINLHVETDHRFRDWSHFIEVFMREYRERIEKERLNEMGPYERRNHSEPLPSFDYDDRSGLDHIVILSGVFEGFLEPISSSWPFVVQLLSFWIIPLGCLDSPLSSPNRGRIWFWNS